MESLYISLDCIIGSNVKSLDIEVAEAIVGCSGEAISVSNIRKRYAEGSGSRAQPLKEKHGGPGMTTVKRVRPLSIA